MLSEALRIITKHKEYNSLLQSMVKEFDLKGQLEAGVILACSEYKVIKNQVDRMGREKLEAWVKSAELRTLGLILKRIDSEREEILSYLKSLKQQSNETH